jgi:hypothetical protein
MATTHKKSVFLTKEDFDFGFGLMIGHGMSWVVRFICRIRVEGKRGGEVKNDLLEEPLDVDDTLSVIPVGELSENVLGEIDVG